MRRLEGNWFENRSSALADWDLDRLLETKGTARVDVILPALDEEDTVGPIVAAIMRDLVAPGRRLVDEVIVVDSGSTDATADRASAVGARVVKTDSVLTSLPVERGKGEAMWRGLAATAGDLVVFLDADLRSFTSGYVVGLLGPLLADPSVHLVKAAYDRPLVLGDQRIADGGGRVTEVLARPLINALWPELGGVAQPLAGEFAARRSLLESLPFPCGYGVETGLLVDVFRAVGIDGIAQVDLGVRVHRHQDWAGLSGMAAEIIHAAMLRADPAGLMFEPGQGAALPGFVRTPEGLDRQDRPVQVRERPPLLSVPEYGGRRLRAPVSGLRPTAQRGPRLVS
ncbi:MAG: glucosyl-3-phosphoglycerate synthase [Candidatus Nanopelagicales bacterium]|nr:glucosyl-3-phosphoglycerate synthase [Candidatus Nanopelagicales bacterium]